MTRKEFHLDLNTLTYEEKQVYDFLKSLTLTREEEQATYILYEPSPEMILEEAIYLLHHVPLNAIEAQTIADHIIDILKIDGIQSFSQKARPSAPNIPQMPTIPTFDTKDGHLTCKKKQKLLTFDIFTYVIVAVKMLILQKEVLTDEDREFNTKHELRFGVGSNAAAFMNLPQWLCNALNDNPRKALVTEDYIWNMLNRYKDIAGPDIRSLVLSAKRSFNNTSAGAVEMYYLPLLMKVLVAISNRYAVCEKKLLRDAFEDALRYNKQYYSDDVFIYGSRIHDLEDGVINEDEFHKRMAILYSKISNVCEDGIERDLDFVSFMVTTLHLPLEYVSALQYIRLVSDINDTFLSIQKKRDFMDMPNILEQVSTNKKKPTSQKTPEDHSIFDKIIAYTKNRYSNAEVQTLIKMLLHIYRADEEKCAIIEQMEQEWVEQHSTKTQVTLQNGATYNDIHDNTSPTIQ